MAKTEFPGFDPVDDATSSLYGNLTLPDMPPPNQNITIIEQRIRQTLLRVVHANRTDGKPLLLFQIVGNVISKKVFVHRLLFRLPLIPDDNSYGLGLYTTGSHQGNY
jgi:hypothetical protein